MRCAAPEPYMGSQVEAFRLKGLGFGGPRMNKKWRCSNGKSDWCTVAGLGFRVIVA